MHTLNNVYPLETSSTKDEAVFLDSVIYSAHTDKVRTLQELYYKDNDNNSNMTDFIPRRYHYYKDLSHFESYQNITMKQFVDWFGINCVINNGMIYMRQLQKMIDKHKDKIDKQIFEQFSDTIQKIYSYTAKPGNSRDDMQKLYSNLQSLTGNKNIHIRIQEVKLNDIYIQLQKVIEAFFKMTPASTVYNKQTKIYEPQYKFDKNTQQNILTKLNTLLTNHIIK